MNQPSPTLEQRSGHQHKRQTIGYSFPLNKTGLRNGDEQRSHALVVSKWFPWPRNRYSSPLAVDGSI